MYSLYEEETEVTKLKTKALDGELVVYTVDDNGYLLFILNSRKVMAVRGMIIKENKVGLIRDNTETLGLLDEASEQLGFWYTDGGNQDDGSKRRQDASTAIKEPRRRESDNQEINTQNRCLGCC